MLKKSNDKNNLEKVLLAKQKNSKNIILKIKVKTNSSKNKIQSILDDNTIKINIKAHPENNKANQELIKFLAKVLDIFEEDIKIIHGKTNPNKTIKILNLNRKD